MLPDLSANQVYACYEFMRTMPPFCHYKMPAGDEIEFQVVKDRRLYGWFKLEDGKNIIAISKNTIGHTHSLLFYMAHEMVHLVLSQSISNYAAHGVEFRKIAKVVCRLNGFDYKVFC